jgi:glyoxylase-like metal-dependent hydrolase (beta-lactamase superfamily II)
MEIIKNIHQIPGVMANSYLLVEPDGLTLIDAGLPGSDKRILQYVEDLGRSPRDVRRILITHADLDHVGGLGALRKATGARVFSSAVESRAMKEGRSSRSVQTGGNTARRILFSLIGSLFNSKPGAADELITDGQMLSIAGGLRVVETTGHTPGHLSFYSPGMGVLFSGDSIVADEKGLQGSRPMYTWNSVKATDAVRRQAALGARIVCPGHGPVIRNAEGKFPSK